LTRVVDLLHVKEPHTPKGTFPVYRS
jgi:hypothetical protein